MSDTVTLPREHVRVLLVLAQKGQALANAVTATALLGQSSPAALLDYVHPDEWSEAAFVRDFIAWTSGRTGFAPGCVDRLREWGIAASRDAVETMAATLDSTERAS